MLKKMRAVAVLAVIALFVLAVAGCGDSPATSETSAVTTADQGSNASTEGNAPDSSSGPKVELKFAFFTSDNTCPGETALWWIDEIQKRTNGQVRVKWFPGGSLLTAKNTFTGVLQGVADVGLACAPYEPGRFPLISINDLPGLYVTGKEASLSVTDVILANKEKMTELKDFYIVGAFGMDPGRLMTIKKYETLESLKSVELRTPGGPQTLQALGITEVAMPQSEIAQALQTGVLDGIYTSRDLLLDGKYAEKTKHMIEYPLGSITFLAVMTQAKYESLPANVQQVIDDLVIPFAEKGGDV
ncbi:MAG: TRAP transporter substrate-binding protein DctP, partial [Actinobacteria bacterium]|nr:TRAP transporter substrate-binding protein DctP [Actinomycetota bacterium]